MSSPAGIAGVSVASSTCVSGRWWKRGIRGVMGGRGFGRGSRGIGFRVGVGDGGSLIGGGGIGVRESKFLSSRSGLAWVWRSGVK